MDKEPDISVVIGTYNRCDLLSSTIQGVLTQEAYPVNYEIIVVDNNSTDATKQVVELYASTSAVKIRYLFERRQGIAHAKNAGAAIARAPIVAFLDDDLSVERTWLATIKRTFDEHPEVSHVGGKILPRFTHKPPSWLTPEHWAPLAVANYGDKPFHVNDQRPVCLMGGNIACRREALELVGGISGAFLRCTDHQLNLSFRRAKMEGLYEPAIAVESVITPDRLSKAYHRQWHKRHGHYYSMLRIEEYEKSRARFLDVPSHVYRRALTDAGGWFIHTIVGKTDSAFLYETRLYFFAGFFSKRCEDYVADKRREAASGLVGFLRSLVS